MQDTSTELQAQTFEYGSLDEDTRIFVKSRTSAIKALMKRTAQDIIEIGQQLIEVKEKIGNGGFEKWIGTEFGWNIRTARRFIDVTYSFKSDKLSDLDFSPSALYLLSAPSTPEEVREEALALAESGEKVTHKVAKELIEKKASLGLIYDLKLLLEKGLITKQSAALFAQLDTQSQSEIYNQITDLDLKYQDKLVLKDSEAKRISDEFAKQKASMLEMEKQIGELEKQIPTESVLDELEKVRTALEEERKKPPVVKVEEKVPEDYEKLKEKVESLKKGLEKTIKDSNKESEMDKKTIERLTRTLDKAKIELSRYDEKRKEMNIINFLHDAQKLINRALMESNDPKGGRVVSESIEDLVYAIKKELDSISLVNRTIDIVEVV